MKIAITGGTGFVGRQIAKRLLAAGHELTLLVNPASPDSFTDGQTVAGRFGDADAAKRLCVGQQAVIHCGWHAPGDSFTDPPADVTEYYQTNVIGSLQLIDAAAKAEANRFIFISSGAVHAKVVEAENDLDEQHPLWPNSIYGAAKAAIETAVHAYGWSQQYPNFTPSSIRPTTIYGAQDPISQSRFYDLVADIVAGKTVSTNGGGKIVHADDVAAATECVLLADPSLTRGETFDCTGGWVAKSEIADIAKQISGSPSEIHAKPASPGRQMSTEKIRKLGMRFKQRERLEQTVTEIVQSLR